MLNGYNHEPAPNMSQMLHAVPLAAHCRRVRSRIRHGYERFSREILNNSNGNRCCVNIQFQKFKPAFNQTQLQHRHGTLARFAGGVLSAMIRARVHGHGFQRYSRGTLPLPGLFYCSLIEQYAGTSFCLVNSFKDE